MGIHRRRRTTKAVVWLALDAGVSSGISIAGTLLAAAIIGPEAVGLASIALGIAMIANFPVEALFADAIVQRRRMTSRQSDAAFWTLVGLAAVLGGGLAASGGLWARLYDQPDLAPMLAVAASALPFTAVSAVQGSLLRRHMRFRVLALGGLVSRTAGAAAAVGLALAGFEGWSLVWQYVVSVAVLAVFVAAASPWRPRLRPSPTPLRGMLSFALVETLSQFVGVSRTRVFLTVVGYHLPLSQVGEINLAFRVVDSLRLVIGTAAGRLCLVLFSRKQDEPEALRALFLMASDIIARLTAPAFAALAVCAPELVDAVFGAAWRGVVPQIQALGLVAALYSARGAAGYLLTATARPGISLGTGVFAFATTLGLLLLAPPDAAPRAIAYWIAPLLATTAAEFLVIRSIFGFGLAVQARALAPGFAAAAWTAGGIAAVRHVGLSAGLPPLALLGVEACAGALLALPVLYLASRTWRRASLPPVPTDPGAVGAGIR